MRYDVFISHASEDKSTVVRDLAHALRSRRFAVWYDEFSLSIGGGLRQSIDEGLLQSRFGIVVLSKAFFAKQWTQWELDGLVQRHVAENNVILPVWHEISKNEIAAYSPSLANIVAANTASGIDEIVNKLAAVLRPEKSSLEVAFEVLRKFKVNPPPISDDWWLSVVEEFASTHGLGNYWSFRTPPPAANTPDRGWHLAWAAMEWEWREEASYRRMACIKEPDEVLRFIADMPGLEVAVNHDIENVLRHAPQLSIPGVAGRFENAIEELFKNSVEMHAKNRRMNPRFGSGLTTTDLPPLCDTKLALRHPSFGDLGPAFVAQKFYRMCDGDFYGVEIADVLFWLLSARSEWVGNKRRDFLLQGISTLGQWGWGTYAFGNHSSQEVKDLPNHGVLAEQLFELADKGAAKVRLSVAAKDDLYERIGYAIRNLQLPESVEDIANKFLERDFLAARLKELRTRRRTSRPRKSVK